MTIAIQYLYIKTMPSRTSVGYRLSDGALKLIISLSAAMGLSKTAVIELAVRELARRNKITQSDAE